MSLLRGRYAMPDDDTDPERALASAVLMQAFLDAKAGDAEAADWMDEIAPGWCEKLLGMDRERIRRWREIEYVEAVRVSRAGGG